MDIVTAALALAEKVLEFIDTNNARKLINDVKQIKLDILDEENRGYASDDAKLETLYKRSKILFEAAQQEVILNATKH